MSSTSEKADDHAYFRAIEATFIRLRGAPLLLSPADWQLASRWRQQGIPLELVLETLERVFRQRSERGARGRVQGLRYCSNAVEEAWHDHQELVATGGRRESRAIDLAARLAPLASSLPSSLRERAQLAARILALDGTAEQVEQELMTLDQEMLAAAERRLDDAEREAIHRRVDEAVTRLAARLSKQEVSRVRDRLQREAVRRHCGLPVLSLFASEAQ